MKRLYLPSFALVGVIGTAALQTPQASQQVKAAIAKQSKAAKDQYLKANEQLKQAWQKEEPAARANLERSGMKGQDVEKEAREGAAMLGREQNSKAAAPKPEDAATASWTRVTQLADRLASHLTSTDPAWQARTNNTVRRAIGNNLWFQPEITAVTPPLSVNPNTVVTHYVPQGGYGGTDGFHNLDAVVNYTNAGAEYDFDYELKRISIPANARTVRVVLRDGFSHSVLRNLVILGYGSAETKFTMSLLSERGTELASASQSMQHSVFLVGGYYYEFNDTLPTVELLWTRPAGNTDRYLSLKFQVESWAGGGPIGSVGLAGYQLQMRAFDVITTS